MTVKELKALLDNIPDRLLDKEIVFSHTVYHSAEDSCGHYETFEFHPRWSIDGFEKQVELLGE